MTSDHLQMPTLFPSDLVFDMAFDSQQTNNRAEIRAVMEAVRWSGGRPLAIHTDSLIVWEWFHHHRVTHRLTKYNQLDNPDLWRQMDALLKQHHGEVLVIKVRAHINNPYNEHADMLAKLGALATRVKLVV